MLTVALRSNLITRDFNSADDLFFEWHLRKERVQGLWRCYSLGLCDVDFFVAPKF